MTQSPPPAQPVSPGGRQVFRVAWQRRVLVLIAVAGATWVGGSLLATLPPGAIFQVGLWSAALAILLGLFVAAMLIVWLWSEFATYLVLTPDGLEYHELGYVIFAPWRDVVSVRTMRSPTGRGGSVEVEGLRLKRSQVRANPACAWLFHLPGGTEFIPLTPLASQWRSNELGLLIFRYAPHVQDIAGAHRANH